MAVTIYHNPRCSKSRQTLALLQARGLRPDIVLYLEDTPDTARIAKLRDLLGLASVRGMMRTKEEAYQALGLADEVDEAKLIVAMAAHPKLIERPIVVAGGQARIGRPPERVLEIL